MLEPRGTIGLFDDSCLTGLAKAAKQNGTITLVQIMETGLQIMSETEIAQIITEQFLQYKADFISATMRCQKAGFDGIELHAAHGMYLDQIITAGTYAANGMGKQSTIIIAVTNKELRDRLSEMNCEIGEWKQGFDPFYSAPAVLIVLDDKNWMNRVYDGSLEIGNLMLAAHYLGIGSCWIHRAQEEFESAEGKEILKDLGVEGDYEGIGHCVLGYPDGPIPKAAPRKENFVYYAK